MINKATTILYYLKNPITPIYDYYRDVSGNYVYLAVDVVHTWALGETDSDGNVKASADLITNDWFLPSKDELSAMYTNLHAEGVGGFTDAIYWSSSEEIVITAYTIDFTDGDSITANKSASRRVRACRTFTSTNTYSLKDVGEGGGLIFYISGNTYYEAAPSDQSASNTWSNITATLIGTTGTAIGTGTQNTLDIIGQAGHTSSAAKLCNDLTLTRTHLSLTVELEWKNQDRLKIATRILRTMGVRLSEAEVFQYAQQLKIEQ